MKKILFITNMYPSKNFPHYGVFIENTYYIIKRSDNKVRLIKLSKSKNKWIKLLKYMLFYLKIVLFGLFFKYDIIYAHYASHVAIPLLIVKKIRKNAKILLNVHGNDIVPEEEKDFKFIKYVDKILKQSDKIIAPSSYFKNILINEYNIDENKIEIYPSSGVDPKYFYKKSKKIALEELKLNSQNKYIGYVSRIEKNKGWDTYVEAIKILNQKLNKDVKFIIVGNGVEDDILMKKINEYNLKERIIKYSYMNHNELCNIYNALDLFCFPTYRKSESLGLVGIEAMKCGCIVLASNIGGPTTYVNVSNGFTFEAKNAEDLANKIEYILTIDENKKNVIKENAIKTAEKYSSEKIGKVLLKIINDV